MKVGDPRARQNDFDSPNKNRRIDVIDRLEMDRDVGVLNSSTDLGKSRSGDESRMMSQHSHSSQRGGGSRISDIH